MAFAFDQLAAWCYHYCNQGFTARSLPGHFSAFKWFAVVEGLEFPERDSTTMERLRRARRALRLRDASEKDPCSVLTSEKIDAMMSALLASEKLMVL